MCDQKPERVVLCGASSYTEKFYFNPAFSRLPEAVKQELKILCVLFTEEAGGVLTLEFDRQGTLLLQVSQEDADYLVDEIDRELRIRRLQEENKDLLNSLEMYYRLVFMGEGV